MHACMYVGVQVYIQVYVCAVGLAPRPQFFSTTIPESDYCNGISYQIDSESSSLELKSADGLSTSINVKSTHIVAY